MDYGKFFNARHDNKSGPSFYILVFFSCLLIFALRNNLNGVFFPVFEYHDGRDLFQPFYNGEGVGYFFEWWLGYLYIFPKAIAYLLSFLPANLIPHAYAVVALGFSAMTFCFLFEMLNGFSGKRFALYATLCIAAFPLGDHYLVTSLAWIIWNFLLILIFLFFIPVPETKWKRILYCFATVSLIWSHPLAVLMLPLYIYRFFSDEKNKNVYQIFIFAAFFYVVFGMIHKEVDYSKLLVLPQLILNRIVLEGVAGHSRAVLALGFGYAWFYKLSILFFLFAFWMLFWAERSWREKEFFFVALYLILGTLSVSVLGGNHSGDLTMPHNFLRYFFVPRTLLWILLFLACAPLIKSIPSMAYAHALLPGFILLNCATGFMTMQICIKRQQKGVRRLLISSTVSRHFKKNV